MRRDYETLDAIVVVGAMAIIGLAVGALIFFDPPQNNLPIIASLLGTLLGRIVGGYAGFRWGASITAKHASESAANTSQMATGALAQLAGAGPQPPAEPVQPKEPTT